MILKYLIQTSIFRYSKNYGSLTHETRIKDAVNMGDLICLLANVRTLKTGDTSVPSKSLYYLYCKYNSILEYASNLIFVLFHVIYSFFNCKYIFFLYFCKYLFAP